LGHFVCEKPEPADMVGDGQFFTHCARPSRNRKLAPSLRPGHPQRTTRRQCARQSRPAPRRPGR